MREKCRNFPITGLAVALFASIGYAQAPEADKPLGGALQAKVLGDRVLARAALQTETWHKETHIVIDFARSTALELHRNAIESLTWGEGEQTLKIVADGFRIEVPRDGVILEIGSLLGAITARYDNELEQIDVSAIVGWQVLRDYAMKLNLSESGFALTPGRAVDIDAARRSALTFVAGVLRFDDRLLVPVNHDAGKTAYMQFNTAGYHTYIDQSLAKARGRPSGDVDDIFFSASENNERISGMVAFFPLDFKAERKAEYMAAKRQEDAVRPQVEAQGIEMPPHLIAKPIVEFDGDVLLRSGLNLLSAYELEINPAQGYLTLTRVADSKYSDAGFDFYSAAGERARVTSALFAATRAPTPQTAISKKRRS